MIGSRRAAQTAARAERGAGWRVRLRRVAAVVLAMTALVVVRPAPASAAEWWDSPTAKWYDGGISYSSVINCPSMIFGSPYYENGIGAFASYAADPDNARPAVGDTTFIKYSIYGMGVPCAGGTYFTPTFYLPPGMSLDTSMPITCTLFRNNANNVVQSPTAGCPGWEKMSQVNANTFKYFNNEGGNDGALWGVVQGQHWTFQLPVKVNQALSGAPLQMHLTLADGNFNPNVLIETPVYVFAGGGVAQPAGVMYEQPSTYDKAGKYGVESKFQAVTNGRGGTGMYEISTSASMSPLIGTDAFSWAADPQFDGIEVTTAWDPAQTVPVGTLPILQPGVTYYWRGVVTLSGQAPTYGAVQSFRLKVGGGVDTTGTLTPGTPTGPGQGGGSGSVDGSIPPPTPTPTQPPATQPPVTQPPVTGPQPLPVPTMKVAAKAKAKKGVSVTVTCPAACTAKGAAKVSKRTAKKLGLKSTTLGSGTAKLSAAGTRSLRITFSKAVRVALVKARKTKATMSVKIAVAGKRTTLNKVVTLTR